LYAGGLTHDRGGSCSVRIQQAHFFQWSSCGPVRAENCLRLCGHHPFDQTNKSFEFQSVPVLMLHKLKHSPLHHHSSFDAPESDPVLRLFTSPCSDVAMVREGGGYCEWFSEPLLWLFVHHLSWTALVWSALFHLTREAQRSDQPTTTTKHLVGLADGLDTLALSVDSLG